MNLRPYQQKTIEDIYEWFRQNKEGNPCVVLPTGSGKSHIVASLCKDALQNWPETRVLMLTHVKELIEQNAEKMKQHWPNAPLGIYSAGIGKKDLGEPITFAGIQSIRKKANLIGHIDLCIIDECHLISHKNEGGYRAFLNDLKKINPHLRIVGLTATPFRLGHGYIIDKPAIFDDLINPVTIEQLVAQGYLSTLKSKVTDFGYNVSGIKKRGGEFIESELQAAIDTQDQNEKVVDEIILLAEERKSWLFFCTGIDHAKHISDILNSKGISSDFITGKTSKKDRREIIEKFKSGHIKALTNANVLTTGFDYPDIDLIAMLRPTMSPALYCQMAGRGMRIKSHTDHCLVLDFAGVVKTHGPVTNVFVKEKEKSGTKGNFPAKTCPECNEILHAAVRVCPSCKYKFSKEDIDKFLALQNDDIMGRDKILEMNVSEWVWRKHISLTSKKELLKVTYYNGLIVKQSVTEYFSIYHDGYAAFKSLQLIFSIIKESLSGKDINIKHSFKDKNQIDETIIFLNKLKCPNKIKYIKDNNFYKIIDRNFE